MRQESADILRQTIAICAALLTLGFASRAIAETAVGTTGAANTQASSTPPGGGVRVIEIGTQVVENEKIETSGSGSVQVLFIDKTTLNIGPHSSIVIDKFVFNPMTTEGELAVTLSKGALRLVGGQATHTGGGTITTPVAAIGVRGGIVTVTHSNGPGTQAFLGYGRMTVSSRCSGGADCEPHTVTVTRPGFMVQTGGGGGGPSQPVRATSGLVDQSNIQLTSKPGQTGGSDVLPTDQQAQGFNVGTNNSSSTPFLVVNPNPGGRGNPINPIIQTSQQAAQQGQQNTGTSAPPPPPHATPVPTAAYAIMTVPRYSTSLGRSRVPYLAGNVAGSGHFKVSQILGFEHGGLNPNGTPDTTSRQFQAGLSVSGRGARQTSTLFVMTSQISNAPGIGFTEGGGFESSSRSSARRVASFGGGAVGSASPQSPSNSVPTDSNGLPNAGYSLVNSTINLDNGSVTAAQSSNSRDGNYAFNPVTLAAPTALTINHPNLALQGYVGGLLQTGYFNPNGAAQGSFGAPYIITNATGKPGDVSIYLPGSSSQMGAIFNVASTGAPNNGLQTASYDFGSYNPADPNNHAGLNTARGAYVDPSDFAGRGTTVFNGGANVPTTTVNGRSLTASGDYDTQIMVTANSVGANTSKFLSSISTQRYVQPCICDYTQWGFWSVDTGRSMSAENGASLYSDRGNLLLWVAGVPTTVGAIPSTGTATYVGQAVADISNRGNQYIAAGSFYNAVNFGTRTGAVAITGLDGANYAGTVNLMRGANQFSGSNILSSTLGRTAAINGSFFQSSTSPYGEMGGSLTLNGRNYLGSGVFSASTRVPNVP